MAVVDLIRKKRDGQALTRQELFDIALGYSQGEVPDYQAAAFLMAVYFRGMSDQETVWFTEALLASGDHFELGDAAERVVDKHSTGGVGDTTTLVLAPLVASVGVRVAKMSGRGLGHTGGTLDKMESIPGLTVALSKERFMRQLREVGVVVASQTQDLVPADGKFYALRDVTATVDNASLIAASIMSKKIASGSPAIVLDVKFGSGAFLKDLDEAKNLARHMVSIGEGVGRRTVAVLSSMEEPLGHGVGNAIEVEQAIKTLRGQGSPDLTELCLALGTEMVLLAGVENDRTRARALLAAALQDGRGLRKFAEFVAAQGGDAHVAEDAARLPQAKHRREVLAPQDGWVQAMDAESIGRTAMHLGAGRARKEDAIDPAAGIVLVRKVGEQVAKGEKIAELRTDRPETLASAAEELLAAYRFTDRPAPAPRLLAGRLDKDGFVAWH